jgi:hypothetical protein
MFRMPILARGMLIRQQKNGGSVAQARKETQKVVETKTFFAVAIFKLTFSLNVPLLP